MILIYDFKIPLTENFNFKTGQCSEEEAFFNCIKQILRKGGFFEANNSIIIKIIKKSIDLRQKEPKAVFTGIINVLNGNKKLENNIINFLQFNTIKARKIEKNEEGIYYYKINEKQDDDKFDSKTDAKATALQKNKNKKPAVLIIGMGPAGIFAAITLLKNGIKPIIIEKGKRVEDREKDIQVFFKSGLFNETSNVAFGEGGAGTFSDGKLTTRKKDYYVGYCLDFLFKMGASKDILTSNRPHLGSDVLIDIMKNIRQYLIKNGAEIHYNEELKDIIINNSNEYYDDKDSDKKNIYENIYENIYRNSKLKLEAIKTSVRTINVDFLILAIGANSFKTYKMLNSRCLYMEQKPFAVGFRIEHKREFIDHIFLKNTDERFLSGKTLSGIYYNISSKRFAGYSFCMCPGGIVICASSEAGHLCVNGMSYSERNLENSNSAIVAPVRAENIQKINDGYIGPLGALSFRKDLEKLAFRAGGGSYAAPFQPAIQYLEDVAGLNNTIWLKDFLNYQTLNSNDRSYPEPSYKPSVTLYKLSDILPDFLNLSIAGSLMDFEMKFPGFVKNSILTGVETGTSSAVRIKRGDDYRSANINGIFPCGEGSGYSGGIITSAIDGIKCALSVIEKINNFK